MSVAPIQVKANHNMRDELPTVSQTLSKRNNFQHQLAESNPDSVRIAWLNSSVSVHHKSRKNKKGHALIEQLRFYCENSSLVGYKYMTEVRSTLCERIMWISIHILMVCTLGIIIWNILQEYKKSPVVTMLDSDHYPSNLLDFPGISVCSMNRISQKAVIKLANEIISLNITNLSFDEVLKLLHKLGNLYESSFTQETSDNGLLDSLLRKYFQGNYQLTKLMKRLTPKCSDMLLKCRYLASNVNCMQLFSVRKTQDGYCCLFNYIREHDDITIGRQTKTKIPRKIEKLTLMNSLSFLLDPALEDYFFTIFPITGWKIMIFNPNDYPDNTSGGVTETIISPSTENFLELNAISFYSEQIVRRFSVKDRKCIFKDEVPVLHNSYTYSDCIVDCKVKDVWKSCGCQPFFYPIRDSHRICNTSDIHCLHEYKSKWWSIMPHDMNEESDESKIFIQNDSWSLHCNNCYPTCDDVRYSLQTSSTTFKLDSSGPPLKGEIRVANQSLVHIFFTRYGTLRLKQDISYYWYELLSDIGGLCGVFIGFSLISAVEFIYFLVLSFVNLYRETRRSKSTSSVSTEAFPNLRPLYWTEIAPCGKIANVQAELYS